MKYTPIEVYEQFFEGVQASLGSGIEDAFRLLRGVAASRTERESFSGDQVGATLPPCSDKA